MWQPKAPRYCPGREHFSPGKSHRRARHRSRCPQHRHPSVTARCRLLLYFAAPAQHPQHRPQYAELRAPWPKREAIDKISSSHIAFARFQALPSNQKSLASSASCYLLAIPVFARLFRALDFLCPVFNFLAGSSFRQTCGRRPARLAFLSNAISTSLVDGFDSIISTELASSFQLKHCFDNREPIHQFGSVQILSHI